MPTNGKTWGSDVTGELTVMEGKLIVWGVAL